MQRSALYIRAPNQLTVQRHAFPQGANVRFWHTRLVTRAEPEDKPDSSFESLFSKELQRRGLSSVDEAGPPGASADGPSTASGFSAGSSAPGGVNPFGSSVGSSSSSATTTTTTARTRSRSPPPPPMAPGVADDQRQKSMDMVNEGLEGLIPRAKLLLQLGGSVFLGFLPFMLVFSLLFTGIYSVFGTSFVHGGRESSGPPAYIDPEKLLSEPTVDPYIPYDANPYTAPDLQ